MSQNTENVNIIKHKQCKAIKWQLRKEKIDWKVQTQGVFLSYNVRKILKSGKNAQWYAEMLAKCTEQSWWQLQVNILLPETARS